MGRRDGTLKQTLRTMSCSGLIEISNLGVQIPVPSANPTGGGLRPESSGPAALAPGLSHTPDPQGPTLDSGPEPISLG